MRTQNLPTGWWRVVHVPLPAGTYRSLYVLARTTTRIFLFHDPQPASNVPLRAGTSYGDSNLPRPPDEKNTSSALPPTPASTRETILPRSTTPENPGLLPGSASLLEVPAVRDWEKEMAREV